MNALVGHEEPVALFEAAARAGRMHHAWLLAGPKGIGKASFALAAARSLLARAGGPDFDLQGLAVPAGHPVAALVDAGTHPDLVRLSRLVDEKTGAVARSISIDQVRGLGRFFGTTGSLSNRRIVIIDAIDDLERPAANALLKNLEEPPADSLFLLVSHAPGRLLPTIRSRCRLLRFKALSDAAMLRVLEDVLPESDAAERTALVQVGEGSPGRALAFAGLDIAGLDRAIDQLILQGDPTNGTRAALARALALKAAQPRYEAFLERVPARIATHARSLSGAPLAKALKIWDEARSLCSGALGLSLDPASTVFTIGAMLATLAPPRN